MGRPRKPLGQHELEGTYRQDRHGPSSTERARYKHMSTVLEDEVYDSDGRAERMLREGSAHGFHAGMDVPPDRRFSGSAGYRFEAHRS